MFLIIGLGNPGKSYENTRHNTGFLALDALRHARDFPTFKKSRIAKALISKGVFQHNKCLLVKPQTFMNASGMAVATLARWHRVKPENILVLYDDIALPFGHLRVSVNTSSGGHNGVQSLITHLHTSSFMRFRIGIAPLSTPHIPLTDYVLSTLTTNEKKLLQPSFQNILEAIEMTLTGKREHVKEKFH